MAAGRRGGGVEGVVNDLALFAGAGGGLLASRLLGWRTVGYVESNDFRQRLLRQRIDDGFLDDAPLFGDIRTFLSEGYAASYSGMVDVVSAGFPCQAFSQAAAGRNDPDKNLWPETAEAIRVVGPGYVLLENSPRIASRGYLGTVLRDLAILGFDARWDVFSAAEVGADHIRQRWWMVGYSNRNSESIGAEHDEASGLPSPAADSACWRTNGAVRTIGGTQAMEGGRHPWSVQPGVDRVANGISDQLERLAALGDAQVPAVAVRAWNELTKC